MIITNMNDTLEYMGKRYYIGEEITGTSASMYEGLFGKIIEIRTDDDKETNNDTPDIYCKFDTPIFPEDIKRFENKVSLLHGKAKTLEDIALDRVIMAPEMIKSLVKNVETRTVTVFSLEEDWATDNDYGANSIFHSCCYE